MRTTVSVAVGLFCACGVFLAITQPDLLVRLLGLVSVVAAVVFVVAGLVETGRWVASELGPRQHSG